MKKDKVKVFNVWTMAFEEVVPPAGEEDISSLPEEQRVVSPMEYEFLQHEYILAIVVKDNVNTLKTYEDVEGSALIRRDFYEALTGREMFDNAPTAMESGSLAELRELKQYDEQKSWKTPLVILSDDKPSETRWLEFIAFQKAMVSNSATSMAAMMFEGDFSQKELRDDPSDV